MRKGVKERGGRRSGVGLKVGERQGGLSGEEVGEERRRSKGEGFELKGEGWKEEVGTGGGKFGVWGLGRKARGRVGCLEL